MSLLSWQKDLLTKYSKQIMMLDMQNLQEFRIIVFVMMEVEIMVVEIVMGEDMEGIQVVLVEDQVA